jgi:tetratricopeptide (TPR) repeat protein
MRVPFVDPLLGLGSMSLALPLVGREMEMHLMQSVLENAAFARLHGARAAIMSGEIGIGKSRLMEELCTSAVQQGLTVLQSCAYETGSMFPYLPFIEALRPLIRSSSETDLRRYTGLESICSENLSGLPSIDVSLTGPPLITALCQLFPELAHRLHLTPLQEFLAPDQAKFRLFDAVATLLERMSQEKPVLLCIDNLQWADSATLELTMYLTVRLHHSRVALIGATRPPASIATPENISGSALPATSTQAGNILQILYELMQQGFLLLLPLGLLKEAAAEQHLHALLPGVLPGELVQELLRRAGGNPFFLEELVRDLCLSQQLVLLDGMWQTTVPIQSSRWPERITQAVRQRLQGLACRELLRIAALLGRTFPLQPLARVSGLPEARTLALIEEALQATLVARVSPASAGLEAANSPNDEHLARAPLFTFCQGIVQEVLVEEIPMQRQREIHGALGAALEEYYGPLAPVYAAELARQYVLSDQQEAALTWSLRAGLDAVRQQAHREALSHLCTALRLLEGGIKPLAGQQWPTPSQVSLSLGEIWLKLGELEQATSAFHQALDSAQHTGENGDEPLTRARANRLLSDAYRLQGKYELALSHLQAAASQFAGEWDGRVQTELELDLISWLSTKSTPLQSVRVASEGSLEAFSRLHSNERLLLLQAEATLDLLLFRFVEAERALWQVHQVATEIGDRGSQGFALHLLGWLRGWGTGIGEAIRLLTQAHELYIASGDPFHAALGDQSLGIIYQASGEMEKARSYTLQGFERARRYGVRHILGWLHCNQGLMALAQGSWEESEAHFRSALEAAAQPGNARIKPLALQGQAMLSARRGNWQEAGQRFQEAVQAALNTEWYPGALALYGHFLAVTGHAAIAATFICLFWPKDTCILRTGSRLPSTLSAFATCEVFCIMGSQSRVFWVKWQRRKKIGRRPSRHLSMAWRSAAVLTTSRKRPRFFMNRRVLPCYVSVWKSRQETARQSKLCMYYVIRPARSSCAMVCNAPPIWLILCKKVCASSRFTNRNRRPRS